MQGRGRAKIAANYANYANICSASKQNSIVRSVGITPRRGTPDRERRKYERGNQATARTWPTDYISVGGGLNDSLTYMLDGGTHNDPYSNANLPLPFPDALQEFKVETSAVPAQYGQHSAGAVNGVTKSGSNEFHGNLFEFVRNKVFNAR